MANLNYYKQRIKRLTLTELLIGINVVMFALTQIVDMATGDGLLRLGAKVNALIGLGEYWRLLSAMFLHADLMHLIFNMMALFILGKDIERFFGKKKFLAIYFISGLVGSAASYLLIDSVSVGASGAIFGLMGANLFLYKLNPLVYKRIYGSDLLILIGINLVLGLISPNIDMAGHIGGLIAGFITASAVGLSYEKVFQAKKVIYQMLIVVLLIAPVVVGTIKVQSKADLFISGAYYYYKEGRIERALNVIDKGLEKYPDQTDLINMKSIISKK